MSKNVRISALLLDQIIELLRHSNWYEYDHPLCDMHDDVFWTLFSIQNKASLQFACNKILQANSPQALDEAYAKFRQMKICALDAQEGIPF